MVDHPLGAFIVSLRIQYQINSEGRSAQDLSSRVARRLDKGITAKVPREMKALLCLLLLAVSSHAFYLPSSRYRHIGVSMQDSSLIEGVRRTTPPGSIVVIKYGGIALSHAHTLSLTTSFT